MGVRRFRFFPRLAPLDPLENKKLDFERTYGYPKRLGVILVDLEKQGHTIKDSVLWYNKDIAKNAVEEHCATSCWEDAAEYQN